MENVFYFAFVGLIVIISLYTILKILIKKFDPEKTRVKLYGILGGMSNKEVISVSLHFHGIFNGILYRC